MQKSENGASKSEYIMDSEGDFRSEKKMNSLHTIMHISPMRTVQNINMFNSKCGKCEKLRVETLFLSIILAPKNSTTA